MSDWIEQLQKLLEDSAHITLITVINTQGSVPRKVGARMMVSSNQQWGTIGGGNLEFSAIGEARDRQLANQKSPQRQKFALGPGLGQCCGGSVEVLFETITRKTPLAKIASENVWCRRIDVLAGDSDIDDEPVLQTDDLPDVHPSVPLQIFEDGDRTWLIERVTESKPTVVVFGAGHVGKAVVAQLALLPCCIIWIDERGDQFADIKVRNSVKTIHTDWPEQEVHDLPDDAWVIVMTHSHATDFNICLALLKKQQFAFLGLIGSDTKRRTFRKRLRQRGMTDSMMDRLCCPIGLAEIRSNRPESIAVGLAAQLMLLWEGVYEK